MYKVGAPDSTSLPLSRIHRVVYLMEAISYSYHIVLLPPACEEGGSDNAFNKKINRRIRSNSCLRVAFLSTDE